MNPEQIVTAFKKLIRYVEDRIVLRNLILAFLIFFFGITFIMQILKIYTRHNQELTVPDFGGLTLQEALHAAQDHDLKARVLDSVFISDHEKGTVVEQNPLAGRKVKKNRMIYLTMNAINPEKVATPDLVDLTLRQARARLESFGLKVGQISYEPNIAINVVLAQRLHGRNIVAGDTIVKGTSIDLVLGKGLSDEQTSIPNLVGLTLEQAKILASDRFLSIGAAVPDQTLVSDEDDPNSFVFRQRPEAGKGNTLPMGSSIDVWITLDSTKIPSPVSASDTLTGKP
jgi:beta-lactam-binding protein with PASTA domain